MWLSHRPWMRNTINANRAVSPRQYGFLVFVCIWFLFLSEITDKLVIVILLTEYAFTSSNVRPWRSVNRAHNIMILKKSLAASNRTAPKQLKMWSECRGILGQRKVSGGHFVELKSIEAAGPVTWSWHLLRGAIYNTLCFFLDARPSPAGHRQNIYIEVGRVKKRYPRWHGVYIF